MACQHFGPKDPRNSWVLPGPWFLATYAGGECPSCYETVQEGEEIRADGRGAYEHRDCVDESDNNPDEFDPFEGVFEKG